jgi:chromosome segregation ATPase
VLKQQVQNLTDRLQNAEQSHEANLNSISRKDRKIEDLKAELESEKRRRIKAEKDARRTDQLAAEERDEHHRLLSEAQEKSRHSQTQYDALVRVRSKEQSEYQNRFKVFRKELDELRENEVERQNRLSRFDVIIEQKNREIETGQDRMEKYEQLFREYRENSDRLLRDLIDGGARNDAEIDRVLSETKEITDKMKWVMSVRDSAPDAE